MCTRDNNYRLTKREGQSNAESLWECVLQLQQSPNFAIIGPLAWEHNQAVKKVYTSRFMRAQWGEVDYWSSGGRLWPDHKKLYGCRSCFPNDRDKIISQNQTPEDRFLATVESTRARLKRARSSVKTGNENLSTRHLSRFRIVSPKNEEKRGESIDSSGMKTHMSRFRALATRPNASPSIAATPSQKTLSGSSWRSWRGVEIKHSSRGKREVDARRYLPDSRKAAESNGEMVQTGACSRFQLRPLWSMSISQSC